MRNVQISFTSLNLIQSFVSAQNKLRKPASMNNFARFMHVYHITLCCEDTILYCLNAHPSYGQCFFALLPSVFSFMFSFAQSKICYFHQQILIQPEKVVFVKNSCTAKQTLRTFLFSLFYTYMQFLAAKSQ